MKVMKHILATNVNMIIYGKREPVSLTIEKTITDNIFEIYCLLLVATHNLGHVLWKLYLTFRFVATVATGVERKKKLHKH